MLPFPWTGDRALNTLAEILNANRPRVRREPSDTGPDHAGTENREQTEKFDR